MPNGAGQSATISTSTGTALTITLDEPVTLGTFALGNSGNPYSGAGYTISGSGANGLTSTTAAAQAHRSVRARARAGLLAPVGSAGAWTCLLRPVRCSPSAAMSAKTPPAVSPDVEQLRRVRAEQHEYLFRRHVRHRRHVGSELAQQPAWRVELDHRQPGFVRRVHRCRPSGRAAVLRGRRAGALDPGPFGGGPVECEGCLRFSSGRFRAGRIPSRLEKLACRQWLWSGEACLALQNPAHLMVGLVSLRPPSLLTASGVHLPAFRTSL